MLITKNPTEEKIQWLISQSSEKMAYWLQDLDDGDIYYWPAGWTSHKQMAEQLKIKEFEKGITT